MIRRLLAALGRACAMGADFGASEANRRARRGGGPMLDRALDEPPRARPRR